MSEERSMRVEAYVDGVLEGEERARFEADMASSPALRAEVRAAQRIDAALRRRFEPPVSIPLPAGVEHVRVGRRFVAWGGLAAAVLVIVGLAAFLVADRGPRIDPARLTPVEVVYRRQVDRGFVPEWKCETDEEFAQVSRDRFGQALLVKDLPPDVEVLGWAYSGAGGHFVVSREEMLLLVRRGRERIMAVVDRAEHDRPVNVSGEFDPPLHVFRGELGALVVYELTPGDGPVVVDRLVNPDAG